MNPRWLCLSFLCISLLLGAQGCVYSGGKIPATLSTDPTRALQTVQALLTSTAPTQPTSSATFSGTASAIPEATSTPQPRRTSSGIPSSTAVCNRAAAGNPIDVTIPDDTVLQPGQAFTKIWKLENAGSCTWSQDYAAVFVYGDTMGAMEVVPLASYVEPGKSVEIAIEMVAPIQSGSYQGNWKLRNTEDDLFGIGPVGDSPFWVRIIVAEPTSDSAAGNELPTLIPTFTKTPQPTPLPTATPPVAVQSELSLDTDYLLDLDLAQVNPSQGADLAYRTGSVGYHWLIPQGEAVLGVFGNQSPGLEDCQSASMSAAPIPVESLPTGLYLCYQTIDGQIGWLRLIEFDARTFTITLEILTWTAQ